MKKATVNDYFRHHWVKLMLFALFTAAVSFFAPLKNFQLKWLIDSKSKQEALGYMGLVFLITFTSWFFERLSRRSFTKLACGAVEQVREQVMERVLRRPVSQYQREGDAAYLSLLTTDLRTLYDDYYMSLFNIAFWGGIMLCALGMYLYISPVMLVGLFLAFDGRLTMGTVSTAASMANFVITPCNQIAQCWAKVRSSKGIRQRLEAAMSGPEKVSAGRAIGKLEHIECKDTGFSYPGAAAPVLRGVRLTVSGQEKAVLVGESGCGKSTLAKLLFQYYPDYTGSILFNGQQLRDIDRQSLYQRVGYIAQTTYLFNDTLRSNICLGADFPEAQLSHAIGTAGLTDWVSTLPDGLDTLISENGKNLSGGQRQRIGIARLALRRYDLIIADEITASLDPDTSGQIMENLLALPCMVVAITHDVSGAFMKQFDKVYRVEHGSVTQA